MMGHMPHEDREIYPSAPVALVAAEVRHSPASPLTPSSEVLLKRALADEFPIARPATRMLSPALPGADMRVDNATRFMSRDRTTSITFFQDSLVLETTRYLRFESFMAQLQAALDARTAVGPLDGLERVGLRYIDEIRVPSDISQPQDWGHWVDPSLLGPVFASKSLGMTSKQWQGVAVFQPENPGFQIPELSRSAQSLVVRYGPGEGYAVDPGGDLRRPSPSPGPFFLIDIDSFWSAEDTIPPLDRTSVMNILQSLHSPVRGLFEALITEKLRKEVLRNEL